MDHLIRGLLYIVAVLGTLYHLYQVLHPYLPLESLRISILDLTQVQRATHVFLISFLGYLLNFVWIKKRKIAGSLPLAVLTALMVYPLRQSPSDVVGTGFIPAALMERKGQFNSIGVIGRWHWSRARDDVNIQDKAGRHRGKCQGFDGERSGCTARSSQ